MYLKLRRQHEELELELRDELELEGNAKRISRGNWYAGRGSEWEGTRIEFCPAAGAR